MKFEKSVEFLTCYEVFPTNGDRMVTRCLESWYVGELTKETIGILGLCILGSP